MEPSKAWLPLTLRPMDPPCLQAEFADICVEHSIKERLEEIEELGNNPSLLTSSRSAEKGFVWSNPFAAASGRAHQQNTSLVNFT